MSAGRNSNGIRHCRIHGIPYKGRCPKCHPPRCAFKASNRTAHLTSRRGIGIANAILKDTSKPAKKNDLPRHPDTRICSHCGQETFSTVCHYCYQSESEPSHV